MSTLIAPSERTDATRVTAPQRSPGRRMPRMRWVRRIHLYSGLLLFPWALLFGISGFLFNHPALGDGLVERHVAGDVVRQLSRFEPVVPEAAAKRVVDTLAVAGEPRYQLDPSFAPKIGGWALFSAEADGSKHTAVLNLATGAIDITTRPAAETLAPAPFAGQTVEPGEFSLGAIEANLSELLTGLDLAATGPLQAHPRVGPNVQFRMVDEAGETYNASYDLRDGKLSGRAADRDSGYDFKEMVSRMHMTHHYPVHMDATWWWALAADATALTLVFWALSGLIMWWQMKALRRVGAVVVAAALILGIGAFVTLSDDIGFLGASGPRGPG